MEISVWLGIALAISAFINVVFFWLLREQSSRLSIIADNSSDLIELISSFRDHVKAVYSLDSFYGDETLEGLMAHARSLTSLLEEQYGEIADLIRRKGDRARCRERRKRATCILRWNTRRQ